MIELQIAERENKIEKINKRLFGGKLSFESRNDAIKRLSDSIKLVRLYDLYKAYDMNSLKASFIYLNRSVTVSNYYIIL